MLKPNQLPPLKDNQQMQFNRNQTKNSGFSAAVIAESPSK